ncbi:ribonuclease H protein [Aureococcus anophagefferens]|nr:ribonuclease H protein [Aureococcus anophagefferens]
MNQVDAKDRQSTSSARAKMAASAPSTTRATVSVAACSASMPTRVKGEDQEVRNVLLVVLAEHEEIRAYGQGFDTREYNGTGFFAFKAHKLLKEAARGAPAALLRRDGGGGPGGPALLGPRGAAAAASPDAPRPPSLAPPPLVNGGGAPVGGGVVPGPAALELGQFAPAPVPYSPFFPPPSMPACAPYYQPSAPPAVQQPAVDIEATVRRLMAEGQTRDLDRDRADAAVNGGLRAAAAQAFEGCTGRCWRRRAGSAAARAGGDGGGGGGEGLRRSGAGIGGRAAGRGPRGSGARTGAQGAAGGDDDAPPPPAPAPPQPPPTATAVRAAAGRSLWVLSLNVRALTEAPVLRRALGELARAGRRPDIVCLQETWGTEASEHRFALEGDRLFAFSRGGRGTRSPGGGLATFVRDDLRAYALQRGESGVVVELSDVVPAVHIVGRSERADRSFRSARFFDPAPAARPEAVTRRSGPNASEIDYVVVDAGRGVDVVACATDGDDDGPLVDMYGGGSYTTDHRAIHTRLRVRVLEARREAAVPRRRVRWGSADDATRARYAAELESRLRATEAARRRAADVDAALGLVLDAIQGPRTRSSASPRGRRGRRSHAADAALAAAAAQYAEVKAAAIAEAAHELLLGQDPGSHEARRLHGIIQTEILGRAARGDPRWSAYLASAVRQFEVAAAIAASSSATSPSPADGVCPPALKCGGWYLELALAAVFDVAMRTGAVPASWRTGYVRWLFKKGDELDPRASAASS